MITVKEAAHRLGVKRHAVNKAIRIGRLPAVKYGRDWLIRDADVEHYRVTRRFAEKRNSNDSST